MSSNFFVPTRFTWRFGGSVVHLCGSFTRWVETVPMQVVPDHPDLYSVIVHLPPGYHQYKFIVDGEWRHDETQPFMPDPLGNVNNWLFVRRMDGQQQQMNLQTATPASYHAPSSQQAHSHHSTQQHQDSLPPLRADHHYQEQEVVREQTPVSTPTNIPNQRRRSSSQTQAMSIDEGPSHLAHQSSDVEMATADSGGPAPSGGSYSPSVYPNQGSEPEYTRHHIQEFLGNHTCYELIPESGKVVLLDLELPVRQAFHALHEQGVPSAPLWDAEKLAVVGMISASDFIHVLRRLRGSLATGNGPMSEAEMDSLTIKDMREQSAADGRPPKPLVYVQPTDSLQSVIQQLFDNRASMAPVVTSETRDGDDRACMNTLLHIATISGILANLMRYFRASLSSLPLLNEQLSRLPIGTWAPDAQLPPLNPNFTTASEGQERRDRRKVRELNCVQPETPLTVALSLLLDAGVSTLPIVNRDGALLDMYARSDITMLARGNSYSRLQWEDMTVAQALDLPQTPDHINRNGSRSPSPRQSSEGRGSTDGVRQGQRIHRCTMDDTLRSVVERLSVPGVRRIFVIDPKSHKPLGIVSLSDVAAFLFNAI